MTPCRCSGNICAISPGTSPETATITRRYRRIISMRRPKRSSQALNGTPRPTAKNAPDLRESEKNHPPPPHCKPFNRVSETDRLHSTLNSVFGLTAFRGAQEDIIRHVTDGGNCLVLMPTGGGKSLCYQLPSLLREGCGIVVSPLIALMRDQVAGLVEAGVNAAVLNSTLTPQEASEVERRLIAGDLDLLYVAPERLVTPRCLSLLAQATISLFAIDEAHCVSQWGHDFRPEYVALSIIAERFPEVPPIALPATADELTRKEIVERLQLA